MRDRKTANMVVCLSAFFVGGCHHDSTMEHDAQKALINSTNSPETHRPSLIVVVEPAHGLDVNYPNLVELAMRPLLLDKERSVTFFFWPSSPNGIVPSLSADEIRQSPATFTAPFESGFGDPENPGCFEAALKRADAAANEPSEEIVLILGSPAPEFSSKQLSIVREVGARHPLNIVILGQSAAGFAPYTSGLVITVDLGKSGVHK